VATSYMVLTANPLLTSNRVRRRAQILIAVSVAAVSLALTPTTGYAEPDPPTPATDSAAAEPQTAAEVGQQVAELNHELEIVTEQYLDAHILLDQREQQETVATAQLREVQADITDLDAEVREIAQSSYTGNQVASFTALMTSTSPQDFLDRLNTLDAISGYNNERVTDLARARQQATELSARAEQARADAAEVAADIDAKKTRMETDLPVLEALMATLTEQELQAALARSHEVADDTSSTESPSTESPSTESGNQASTESGNQNESSAPPSSPIVAPTEAAQIAVDTAYAQLGDPYVWAADGPDSFDCSGLTMYSYAAAGISLPHSSNAQSTMGMYVPRDQLLPGDLVFYYSPISHVGIYIGNGQIIHAPNTGSVVSIQDVDGWDYNHAQRVALP